MIYIKTTRLQKELTVFVKLTLIWVGAVVILESTRISEKYRF
jgi:hypothetical protein